MTARTASLLGILTALALFPESYGLVYKWPVAMYGLGREIVPNTPLASETLDNAAQTYWVSPSLPSGLVLDSQTGELRGIPQGEPSAGWYEIRSGDEWADLYIVVDERVPDAWLGFPPLTPRENDGNK